MKVRFLILCLILSVALSATLSLACSNATQEQDHDYGPPQVQLPIDEGAHPEAAVEWWYLNATLHGSDGVEYTAMAAYFRPTLRILSIADLNNQIFYQYVPSIWELTQAAPAYSEGKLDLGWGESDRWYRLSPDSATYHLQAAGGDIKLDLNIISGKAPMMVGGNGLIEWTKGSTYYYSLTRLAIDGQIELDGRTVEVEGMGWMDHQWMDETDQKGWDWFSIQLEDDTDIICWQIVNADGSIESRDLTMMFADESIYHTVDLGLEKTFGWTSPATGEQYGTIWRLTESRYALDLEIQARFSEQEIILFPEDSAITWQFWEGGTMVSGTVDGSPASGNGYMELVPRMGP